MTITIAPPTVALVLDEPTEWTDRNLPTASAWVKYLLEPGTYPFEWVTIGHHPWNADPNAHTSGFIANTGPYYGRVSIPAREVESYYVNRLFTASSVDHKTGLDRPATIVRTVYAYQLPGCPKVRPDSLGQHGTPLTSFMGGQVVPL
jgi:hypothetical protein